MCTKVVLQMPWSSMVFAWRLYGVFLKKKYQGFLTHSLHSGHYTTLCKHSGNPAWCVTGIKQTVYTGKRIFEKYGKDN